MLKIEVEVEKVAFPRHLLAEILLNHTSREIVAVALSIPIGRCLEIRTLIICRNLSLNTTSFLADPQCIAWALSSCKTPYCIPIIVHSHRWSSMPSKSDIESMNIWRTIWVIISQGEGTAKAWLFSGGTIRELEVVHGKCPEMNRVLAYH